MSCHPREPVTLRRMDISLSRKAEGRLEVAQYNQYQANLELLRKSPYMEFPSHVHMETLALCPAACSFCPYPTLDRQGTRMSDELIAKIISDLKDIPANLKFQLSPFKVNEPFADSRLLQILKTINTELPNALLTLTTNTVPLTEEKLTALGEIENIAYLWVSLNDHRPDAYTETMKLPWDRTYQRLKMLHAAKEANRLPFDVILSRVGDGTQADLDFQTWVSRLFPLFKYSVFQRGNWLGQVDLVLPSDIPDVGCSRWFELSITATGTVAHCCMDGKAEWPLGDINTEHVLAVYNNPEYRQLREKTITRRAVSPCNTCTFL